VAFLALSAFAGAAFEPAAARAADASPNLWFGGTRLIFDHAQPRGDELAVGSNDVGLRRFLARVGATIAYEEGERYVVVTSADRRTISFSLGDVHFRNGNLGTMAQFAPFASGGEAFVPLFALAKALYVEPIALGGETVLQPRLGALDLRVEGKTTFVTLHGATPLRFTRLGATHDQISLAFPGIASSLDQSRIVATPGLGEVNVLAGGSPKSPSTTVSFELPQGAVATLVPAQSPNEVAFAFGQAGAHLAGSRIPSALAPPPDDAFAPQGSDALAHPPAAAAAAPAPAANFVTPAPKVALVTPAANSVNPAPKPAEARSLAPPAASAAPAAGAGPAGPAEGPAAPGGMDGDASAAAQAAQMGQAPQAPQQANVTAVEEHGHGETLDVHVALSAPVAYEWHRLPDQRWYLDLKGATLTIPARADDLQDTTAALTLRVKQFAKDPIPVVRISLALVTPRKIDLTATPDGIQISVGAFDDEEAARVGAGRITPGASIAATPVENAPPPLAGPFAGPVPGARNSKLIVIDPGHGGSDPGAQHYGLSEKNLTLDIAKRLRDVLTARGWSVKLTRETDTDVFGPNASAVDELQARCDVANNAGALLFLSIHINSFTDGSLDGTTTYYYKGTDAPLARSLQRRLIAALGTSDKGVRHANFYVNRHATMPSALVETAFVSNRGDAKLLATPEFRQKVASALADGIDDYTGNPTTTSSAAQ
jgi:N-acetylmuramoyl-L-alanine amidase CwlD